MGAFLLALALLQSPRRVDGGVWALPNIPPAQLVEADVDALMWPIVSRINRSGWIWTTESCQGHDGGYPLTLGLSTNDPGRFFTLLATAQAHVFAVATEHNDPQGLAVSLAFWVQPHGGRVQVRLVVTEAKRWALARVVFHRFAELT